MTALPTSTNEYASPLNDTTPDDVDPMDHIFVDEGENLKRALRLRRDLASHQTLDADNLLRFVVAPDGVVTPDLNQELPGRGLWVRSERASLELVIRKNLFSRAAKRAVKADLSLIELVHSLLQRKICDLIGLAKREGVLLHGFDKVNAALKSGKVSWLIEAADGAADGRRKMLNAIKGQNNPPNLLGCLKSAQLDLALGQENVIHAALLRGRRDVRFSYELNRLSGFEPLVPLDW